MILPVMIPPGLAWADSRVEQNRKIIVAKVMRRES